MMRTFLRGGVILAFAGLTGCSVPVYPDPKGAVGLAAMAACSNTFVSGFSIETAYDRLVKPVVEVLSKKQPITVTVLDTAAEQSVSASLVYSGSAYQAKALYRVGLGCTPLVSGDVESLLAQPFIPPSHAPLDADEPWPLGDGPADTEQLSTSTLSAIEATVRTNQFNSSQPLNTLAVAIAQHGRLIYERYASDYRTDAALGPKVSAYLGDDVVGPNTRLLGFSATKSVLALGYGIHAAESGLNIGSAFPQNVYPTTRALTYQHLLQMASGISWNENPGLDLPYYRYRSSLSHMLFENADQAAYMASLKHSVAPGSTHEYNTGNSVLLMRALQNNLLAEQDLPSTPSTSLQVASDFFQDRLFGPTLVTSAMMAPDEVGTYGGGSFMMMTARDWLRLGQLVLDGGYVGETPVVPETWIDDVMLEASPKSAGYGGHIWLGSLKTMGSSKDVCVDGLVQPQDAVEGKTPWDVAYFSGLGGQKVIVVPSRDLVFVRFALSRDGDSGSQETFKALCQTLEALPD